MQRTAQCQVSFDSHSTASMSKLNGSQAAKVLVEAATHENPHQRLHKVRVLRQLGHKRAGQVVVAQHRLQAGRPRLVLLQAGSYVTPTAGCGRVKVLRLLDRITAVSGQREQDQDEASSDSSEKPATNLCTNHDGPH